MLASCLRNDVRLQANIPTAKRSEFQDFPIFCIAQLGTRRAVTPASPSFAYFSWRSKKSEQLPGCPRPAPS